jgi:hypothetical protein
MIPALRWREGDDRLRESLETAIATLTVPDRLALLERLIALDGPSSPTVALVLNQALAHQLGHLDSL